MGTGCCLNGLKALIIGGDFIRGRLSAGRDFEPGSMRVPRAVLDRDGNSGRVPNRMIAVLQPLTQTRGACRDAGLEAAAAVLVDT